MNFKKPVKIFNEVQTGKDLSAEVYRQIHNDDAIFTGYS